MKKIQAVLFDMDGVILDSETPAFELIRQTLKTKGVEISVRELAGTYTGMTSNVFFKALKDRYGFKESPDELRDEHLRISGNFYRDAELVPMPSLLPVLEYLHEMNIPMAVVSSTLSRDVLFTLNKLSILRFFSAIVGGDMVDKPKPDAEPYLTAAFYLNMPPESCIIIEDSPIGIGAARNAGITVIGFKGSEHIQDTSRADLQMSSHDEVLVWLKNNIAFKP